MYVAKEKAGDNSKLIPNTVTSACHLTADRVQQLDEINFDWRYIAVGTETTPASLETGKQPAVASVTKEEDDTNSRRDSDVTASSPPTLAASEAPTVHIHGTATGGAPTASPKLVAI